MDIRDGTGAGLLLFLDKAVEEELINPSTARSYRSATRGVLYCLQTPPEQIDLRQTDPRRLLTRFHEQSELSPTTKNQYDNGFRKSLRLYSDWLAGNDWRLAHRPGTASARRTLARPRVLAHEVHQTESDGAPLIIEHQLPLRSGLRAKLALPDDLTPDEAKRIAAFVSALAVVPRAGDGP